MNNTHSALKGKHIVLGITGGIAAYKTAILARLFVKAGAEVQVIMTPNAKEFITPLTLSTLTGKPVISEFFTANTGEWHSHVDLGLWADAFVVAPATASSIAKMANGIADNMLITSYLSTRGKVFIAPAMDFDMMRHPSTEHNIDLLRSYGATIIEPTEGELASHLVGKGRMEEPDNIFKAVEYHFGKVGGDLKGKKVMITAGPTYEKIDPVRFIGNFSSGLMGFSLANEAARRGADVVLISGPVGPLELDNRVKRINVQSALEMYNAAEVEFQNSDIAILAAAVADYRPEQFLDKKIKRESNECPTLRLIKNPDIAASLGKNKNGRIVVGFALETDNELGNAFAKLKRKNLDMIVLNSLNDSGACFGVNTNKITILTSSDNIQEFSLKTKAEVASDIIDSILRL